MRVIVGRNTGPMVAIAKPELELKEYTGTRGCYACCLPDEKSKEAVGAICDQLNLERSPDELHCTLMYSKEVAPLEVPLPESERFEALGTEVFVRPGHDDKIYIVLILTSPDIVHEHARLLKLGAEHSFCPFEAHVTLYGGTDVDKDALEGVVKEVNQSLARNPVPLLFTEWAVADIKDD